MQLAESEGGLQEAGACWTAAEHDATGERRTIATQEAPTHEHDPSGSTQARPASTVAGVSNGIGMSNGLAPQQDLHGLLLVPGQDPPCSFPGDGGGEAQLGQRGGRREEELAWRCVHLERELAASRKQCEDLCRSAAAERSHLLGIIQLKDDEISQVGVRA